MRCKLFHRQLASCETGLLCGFFVLSSRKTSPAAIRHEESILSLLSLGAELFFLYCNLFAES